MRTIFILIAIITQLFTASVSFAQSEAYDDCKTSCTADRSTRDADCPSPYDSSSGGQDRDQCLQSSRDSYDSCIKSCPPPPPVESSPPSSMSY